MKATVLPRSLPLSLTSNTNLTLHTALKLFDRCADMHVLHQDSVAVVVEEEEEEKHGDGPSEATVRLELFAIRLASCCLSPTALALLPSCGITA
jgi:hypothetical protein